MRLARELGAEAGVVLGWRRRSGITPFLPEVAFVTLLGTAIGVKGQSLSDKACPRLIDARALMRKAGREADIVLAADGGIRHETVPLLRAAGARRWCWVRWLSATRILRRASPGCTG